MFSSTIAMNYLGYAILLALLTGALLLWVDVPSYDAPGMKREKKTARAAAWINLSLGGVGFLVKMIFA